MDNKFEEFCTPIAAKNHFIKASFGGFAGSGKTRTATEFVIGAYKQLKCTKPILIVDNEKGSRFLIPFFKEAGIDVRIKDTLGLADIIQAFKYLNEGEIDFLFIDSLSKIWYQYVKDYKAKNRKTFMTLQDWGKILPSWQEEFADRFVELNGNCVFTGRGGYTYDMEENTETHKKEFIKSGVKMKLAGETPFEPDINVWMDQQQSLDKEGNLSVWREAQILKDRSALIDGKTFKNPKYEDFKPVVDFLCNVNKGEVAGKSSIENLAPSEIYSDKKEKREIELENLKGYFDGMGLGTGTSDKKIKAYITEQVFGTVSLTAIEKFPLDQLQLKVDTIKKIRNLMVDEKGEMTIEKVQAIIFKITTEA